MSDFDALAEEFTFWGRTFEQRRYEQVLRVLPQGVNRLLNAGCCSVSLAFLLAKHARRVVATDSSRAMLDLARKRQSEQQVGTVDFVVADPQNLPFAERTFDFIVSTGALHHTRLDISLPRLRRLVKPGGRMLVHDLVTSHPRLHAYRAWNVWRALLATPTYASTVGVRAAWRILRFRTSPAWLRHVTLDGHAWVTPLAFQEVYSRFLPGCRFERLGWEMAASWEAPGELQPG
jgi:ubiquinone/menaquinone biosynthesis C-methylase UbiE